MSDEEIRGLWRTMADGWARGDASAFAAVFAEDVDFVNVRGEVFDSREAVESSHARLFETLYRGSKMTAEVELIRPLGEHIRLVHVSSTVSPPDIGTHAQAVVTRRDGVWSIAAFHNMMSVSTKGSSS